VEESVNAHALEALEFERVRALLVARAASAPGQERAAALAPLEDLPRLLSVLETVGEAVSAQIEEPEWREIRFPDVRQALSQATVEGSVLEPPDFVAIAQMLRVSSSVAGFFGTEESRLRRPMLARLARCLLVEHDFPRRVERVFEPSGEVRDGASRALRSIRSEIQRTRQLASGRLENMSQRFRASGEDSFVTLRGGRYVLSVAAGEKRQVQGIVHDRSATGKTLYVEPIEIIEMNNALAELEAGEREEVHRILREMTTWVRESAEGLRETLCALADLDEVNARARLARDLDACAPAIDEAGETLRIVSGRHPLLLLAMGKRTVPLDLTLERERRGLVISGPNMGGKTVVLKTVGLLLLMALAGLFVPATDGTVLPWADEVYVDIGDEQSLDSDVSTYAARLRNMRSALERATARSVVLLDELGAGTDPAEGAALGQALLREIDRRRAFCIASTHLGAFKIFAAGAEGFENAAMEYSSATLRPTYQLIVGLPGRSHAFELARREGWPARILEVACGYLPAQEARADTLLEQIEAERQALKRGLERADDERGRLASEREETLRLAAILKEKTAAIRLETVLAEDCRLKELRALLGELREKIARIAAGAEEAEAASLRRWFHSREREVADLEKLRRFVPRPRPEGVGGALSPEDLTLGKRVFSKSLGMAVVIAKGDAGAQRVWVEHRGVRVALPADDMLTVPDQAEQIAEPADGPVPGAHVDIRERVSSQVTGEIDLRGLNREECLAKLDLYLDRAMLAGYPSVRIIHGKGTGILRREVRIFLRTHKHVSAYRTGEGREGGWGVTIATLERGEAARAVPRRGENDRS
jgi:DNA mismatch repair protein MutS2